MPSDIDIVVTQSKQIEQLLEQKFAAKGRGLHEKVDSVTHVLDAALVKRLRWIATMRNKVVHEDFALPSQDDFSRSCQSALDTIQTMHSSPIPPFNQQARQVRQDGYQSHQRTPTPRNRHHNRRNQKQSSNLLWLVALLVIGVMVMIFGGLK